MPISVAKRGGVGLVQYQLKLRLTAAQKTKRDEWLPILGAIYNFGIRKIELNANDGIYFRELEFHNLLSGHSQRLGIPSHVIQGVLSSAYASWERFRSGLSGKPKLKGFRRLFNSIPFPDPIRPPRKGKITLLGLGKIRFHKQFIPSGKIKCGRLISRASGDYLCLFIDADPRPIERTGNSAVGVDPGFKDLLTLSTGEVVAHPHEYRRAEGRIAQSQRGHDKGLARRLHERSRNRRKDRNHKLSRRLVSENKTICFLRDTPTRIVKLFGKSVIDSAHGGLRKMLQYKSLIGGTELIFPENRNSTRTCSTCGDLTGPRGLAGLKVREWDCGACGAHHERDVNAARNALISGLGWSHEKVHVNA